ncbi:MAG: alpha/beta hydrolase [Clostridia bacterium]|nr:alpha/beta hydrolase [Clostridia bacterium]
MNRTIYLWNGTAPYTDESPDRLQPSLKAFELEGTRSAIIVCAGGAYEAKMPYECDDIAIMFNEHGLTAFVLDYRVAPCGTFAPLADVNRAVRVVRSLGYEKVGVIGFSAGGNLCCNAAVHYDSGKPDSEDPIERYSSRPDAFLPCYAVVSLTQFTHVQTRQNLLKDRRDDQALARYFSAEQHITEDTPPAFIWHSATDEMVPVDNSLILGAAMAAKGVPFEMHIFPEGLHGLGLAKELPVVARWSDMACDWLERQGFKA